jgi:hypothetical protein
MNGLRSLPNLRSDYQTRSTYCNIMVESMKHMPPEILATMPEDGASQHDHYIYGWPKKSEG